MPLRIEQRQRPRLRDRNALLDAKNSALDVACVDVERDDARIRNVARLGDWRREWRTLRLAGRAARKECRRHEGCRAKQSHAQPRYSRTCRPAFQSVAKMSPPFVT
jgi:hypothetical protein